MQTKTIEYFDGDQKLIGELFYPKDLTGQNPGVIVFPAFEGRGSFALDYAKKLAEQGFMAFAADVYGDAKVANTIERCFELITPFLQERDLVRRRSLLAFEVLQQQAQVNKDKIGAIGFCFGGMCALEVARSGANLQAGISVHGVLSKSDLPTEKIKGKILALHGYKDPQSASDHLVKFAEEMDHANVEDWTFTYFGNAKHSFTDPKTGTFNPAKEKEMGREYNRIAAERSFQYALQFFNEILKN